jgi:hypothetical protein
MLKLLFAVAIIGACGPTIKYIFSCCIPALRSESDSKRDHSYDNSGYGNSGYRNSSSKNQFRRTRPNTYRDLNSTVDLEVIEMKAT